MDAHILTIPSTPQKTQEEGVIVHVRVFEMDESTG